jgi:hypothetical protein
LDAFLAHYSRESRENMLCLRNLLLEIFPKATEHIDVKTGIITYSGRGKTDADWFFTIALHMKHINLIFRRGALLSDPTGLLAGNGKEARHIRIRSEDETQNPALRQLLEAALKLA